MATYHNRRVRISIALLLAGLSACPLSSHAGSRYELFPPKQNNFGYLGFQSKWQAHWFQGKESYLSGYWDTTLPRNAYPTHYSSPSLVPPIQEFGITAILRYQRNDGTGFYAEAGTGPQYHSIASDWVGRPQASRLLLNTSAGIGFVWKNGVDLGFKASYLTRGQGVDGNEGGGVIGIGLLYRW